jgi:hypothetical protein
MFHIRGPCGDMVRFRFFGLGDVLFLGRSCLPAAGELEDFPPAALLLDDASG